MRIYSVIDSFKVRPAGVVVGLSLMGMIMGCAVMVNPEETSETKAVNKGDDPIQNEKKDPPKQSGDATERAAAVCGDPVLTARYNDCDAAKGEKDCVAAGGKWTTVGLSEDKMCQCFTGQEGCACETSKDCLSICIAPLIMSTRECAEKKTCSKVSKTAGCWCIHGNDGSVNKICVD